MPLRGVDMSDAKNTIAQFASLLRDAIFTHLQLFLGLFLDPTGADHAWHRVLPKAGSAAAFLKAKRLACLVSLAPCNITVHSQFFYLAQI